MHNLINRRRTSRINELINALADKVPQLHEPIPAPLPGTKDGRSKAAVLQGARLTRPARVSPGESSGEGDGRGGGNAEVWPGRTLTPFTPPHPPVHPTPHALPDRHPPGRCAHLRGGTAAALPGQRLRATGDAATRELTSFSLGLGLEQRR